jgi:queuosine precursor transporter
LTHFKANKAHFLFIVLGAVFITNALIAEFIGIKIFSLEATFGFNPFTFDLFGQKGLSFQLSAGVLLWPVVFVLTDIINEYYGIKGVRLLSFLAVGMISYAFIMFFAGIQLVPAEWWITSSSHKGIPDMNNAFGVIYGQGLWIIIGSLVAFLVGQFVDVFVFQQIKKRTGEKAIWLRATGSTLISQFIDSYIVLLIAFYIGQGWPIALVLAIGSVNYIYKFIMAVVLTPVIYAIHFVIEKYLGHDLATKLKQDALLKKK